MRRTSGQEKQVTEADVMAAVKLVAAIGEAIKELGSVPSGVLYARVMSYLDVHQYNQVIGTLKRCRLVTESNNVLTWVEPVAGSGGERVIKAWEAVK